ncbi:hypothetical protein [Natronomonas gomsonensis]|nr:hypothetical protein [Natronomonas gomsonensis]
MSHEARESTRPIPGFNSARESAGAIVEHDSTLRVPGVAVLGEQVG